MPATYEPIATTTVAVATSAITFSSIPSTYTDLKIVVNAFTSSDLKLTFNNDSATNYSQTSLYGNGTSAASIRQSNASFVYFDYGSGTGSSTIPVLWTADTFSYAGSTYKTSLLTASNDVNGGGAVERQVCLWRSTSAINRIDLTSGTALGLLIGTTATLYGIKAA